MGASGSPLKVVLDSNILVSALVIGGRLSGIVELWRRRVIVPVFSKDTFAELEVVLTYPKLRLTSGESKSIIVGEILPYCEIVEVVEQIHGICGDPDDDKFLSCAVAGGVGRLVTGDKVLRSVGRFREVVIQSPAEFLSGFSPRESGEGPGTSAPSTT